MSQLVRKPSIRLLKLPEIDIFSQLQLEEAILRNDDRNYFLYSECSRSPVVVLGISGKPEKLVDLDNARRNSIQLIRRFTGGGTVVVDQGTLFASFICNSKDLTDVKPYPHEIMQWTASYYSPIFNRLSRAHQFSLLENDYAFGLKKIGGNAQSISKGRWIHHTSFLWDFNAKSMTYLKIPEKAPKYRKQREHHDFLDRLCNHIPQKESIYKEMKVELEKLFEVEDITYDNVKEMLHLPHRQTTSLLDY